MVLPRIGVRPDNFSDGISYAGRQIEGYIRPNTIRPAIHPQKNALSDGAFIAVEAD
ncbi:MAG TPA: hypothetical protein PL064_07195 [Thermogutta sp.]|nr:hypothetical protein [Thermogutta sp.]